MSEPLPKRKRPVHMSPLERHNQPVILFVTMVAHPRVPAFANEFFHRAFCLACADADAWSVGEYMIMPDHLHLFCSPATVPRIGIKRWSSYLKERITKRLKRISPASCELSWKWQNDCWDTQIRSGEHYHEKFQYMIENPVRKRLVRKAEDWPWQGEINVLRW